MDNAQKAIMIGVGLFITIIIISAVMLITSAGQDLMNGSMDELSNISDSLSRQLYADFAGSELSGSQVIAAIKRYAGTPGLKLQIKNAKKKADGTYNDVNPPLWTFTSDNISTMAEGIEKINPNARYESAVSVEDNVVKWIVFRYIVN